MASCPFIAWLIREMTSAPKGAWPLSVELTAAAMPVRRFIKVPTSVVGPTSNTTPKHSSVGSPGSTPPRGSPASTAVRLKPAARRGLRRVRRTGTLEHANLALAACTAPPAGGVDGQTDPVRGAEQGGSGRNPGGPVEGLVGHLQLALDH